MVQVKIFRDRLAQDLEDSMNLWLKCQNSNVTVIDIKYSVDESLRYNAMVIFEVEE